MELSETVFELHGVVISRYQEPHRYYHNLQHLEECFVRLVELEDHAQYLPEIELALWFHDAVYDVRGAGNEVKSADWARASALQFGVDEATADRIHGLIMATCHASIPQGKDQEILVDVDLSILGAQEERFWEYERQVREEYAWVPEDIFCRERAKILTGFLERSSIFTTPRFQERYEKQARANLRNSIERLGGG